MSSSRKKTNTLGITFYINLIKLIMNHVTILPAMRMVKGRQYNAHTVNVQYILWYQHLNCTQRRSLGPTIWTSFDASITETNSCSTASELQIQISVLPSIPKACWLNEPSIQNSLWCGEWGQPKSFEVATGSTLLLCLELYLGRTLQMMAWHTAWMMHAWCVVHIYFEATPLFVDHTP